MIDFCIRNGLNIMNGFKQHKETHKYSRYRWNSKTGEFDQKSIIDYFVTSDKIMVNNVKVLQGESLDY
jgi:hypothetical protein